MATQNLLKNQFFFFACYLLMVISACYSSTSFSEETGIVSSKNQNDLTDIIGIWQSIDDETGQAKSLIEISVIDGVYSGKILKVLNSDQTNPICNKCKGEKANQAIEGMTIIDNVKKIKDYWGEGTILDPKNGKTYKVKFTLIEDGNKLNVRGFVGIPTLGRTQVWLRK